MNDVGLVLETARRAEGMTQAELAATASITQAALSRYENGMREPDAVTMDRLSAALNLTSAFVSRASSVRGAVAVEAHMRRRKTARPSDWRRLEARLNMHRLHARRLFDEIAVRAEQRIPTFDPFELDASNAALFLRMQWRLPSGPVHHLVRWLEAAGCIVIVEDFGTRGVDGLSQWIDDVPIILMNVTAPTDRRRLTLAHELGHLCLHSQDVVIDLEDQASAFAAEFLMPSEYIRPQLRDLNLGRLLDLKRVWEVSMQALIERAWQLKQISSSRRTYLYKQLSAQGWRRAEPVSDELPEESPALPERIGAALVSSGLSVAEIAHLVGFSRPDTPHPFVPKPKLRVL